MFYEILYEIEEAYANYRMIRKTGQKQKAREYGRKHKAQINLSKLGRKARQKIGKINTRIRLIELSRKISPDQKRQEINDLIRKRQKIIRKFLKRYGG